MKLEIKKKVLFTSHLANFAKFNKPFMQWFREQGWEVHYASLDEEKIPSCDKHFKICFNRSPYSLDNLKAYRQLKKIIREEQYALIHCHTPMGGVVTRLAAIGARKYGTRVLYTAHGFHFYNGASAVNWLLYYPIEKFLARFTDCLIVMNQEDYMLANTKRFKSGRIEKIDGVGVDLSRFSPPSEEEKANLRQEYGFHDNAYILLYIAEFTKNKNHEFLVSAISGIKKQIPNMRLIFAGKGKEMEYCKNLAKSMGLVDYIKFLGYRNDVPALCKISDILVSASGREGLPVNILEGMATGLPVVCTAIRGQVDVITSGINGLLFRQGDAEEFCNKVCEFYENYELRYKVGNQNLTDVKRYSVENAVEEMAEIYESVLGYKIIHRH